MTPDEQWEQSIKAALKPQPTQMTETQLIHEGWFLWNAPTIYIGEQWSYEEKQAMLRERGAMRLGINRIRTRDITYSPHTHAQPDI